MVAHIQCACHYGTVLKCAAFTAHRTSVSRAVDHFQAIVARVVQWFAIRKCICAPRSFAMHGSQSVEGPAVAAALYVEMREFAFLYGLPPYHETAVGFGKSDK